MGHEGHMGPIYTGSRGWTEGNVLWLMAFGGFGAASSTGDGHAAKYRLKDL